jgi:hypothetical protein
MKFCFECGWDNEAAKELGAELTEERKAECEEECKHDDDDEDRKEGDEGKKEPRGDGKDKEGKEDGKPEGKEQGSGDRQKRDGNQAALLKLRQDKPPMEGEDKKPSIEEVAEYCLELDEELFEEPLPELADFEIESKEDAEFVLYILCDAYLGYYDEVDCEDETTWTPKDLVEEIESYFDYDFDFGEFEGEEPKDGEKPEDGEGEFDEDEFLMELWKKEMERSVCHYCKKVDEFGLEDEYCDDVECEEHEGEHKKEGQNMTEGKQDGGKQDGGKQDGGKQDGGKQDGGKQDGGKQDGGKQDGGKPADGKPPKN